MSSVSHVPKSCENHYYHLFSAPFCEKLDPWKKVAHFAFYFFAVPLILYPIGLACYRALSWCVSQIPPQLSFRSLQQSAFPKDNPIDETQHPAREEQRKGPEEVPYSQLGREALEFARGQLREHPDTQPWQFTKYRHELYKPKNEEIALLRTLLYGENGLCNKFIDLLTQYKDNPWKQQEVIDTFDACMKIAYAISNLTLDELKACTTTQDDPRNERSYAQALVNQDSYQYHAFFDCPEIYRLARRGLAWIPESSEQGGGYIGYVFWKRLPEGISPPFYQEDTKQFSWRLLYNEYSQRIRSYVSEEELGCNGYDQQTELLNGDKRHVLWTGEDQDPETFTYDPGTKPT